MPPSLLSLHTPALRRVPSSSAASASLVPTIALTTLYLQRDMSSMEVDPKLRRKPKRPADYDSNRARARQRQEILVLRQTVQELELKIARLRSRRSLCGKSESLGVWERLALHQRRERHKAEEENRMLKGELDAQREIARLFQGAIEITDPSAFKVKSIL